MSSAIQAGTPATAPAPTRARPRRERRLVATPRALRTLASVCADDGPQVVWLSWPGGATVLPGATFEPAEFDVIVAHLAGCPVYADVRQLDLHRDRRAVLDLADPAPGRRPRLRLQDR